MTRTQVKYEKKDRIWSDVESQSSLQYYYSRFITTGKLGDESVDDPGRIYVNIELLVYSCTRFCKMF